MDAKATTARVLALDFDGVLCDSAGETGDTGWRAAAELWPEAMPAAPPPGYLERFRRLRPVVETGYESMLVARLLVEGAAEARILGEFRELAAALAARHGLDRAALVRRFGGLRDRRLREDFAGWLGLHGFYPGVVAAVNAWVAAGHVVAVITTKETRFARALCEYGGLRVDPALVYGLEAGKKAGVLRELLARHPGAAAHFVEDRLDTLLAIAAEPDFAALCLHFAEWGYVTAAMRAAAARDPRLRYLRLADFPALAGVLG